MDGVDGEGRKEGRNARETDGDASFGAGNRRRRFGEVRITTSCACRMCTD